MDLRDRAHVRGLQLNISKIEVALICTTFISISSEFYFDFNLKSF